MFYWSYKPDNRNGDQFAVAVNLPKDQCANFDPNLINGTAVKQALQEHEVYTDDVVVAASPRQAESNVESCDGDAEYMLLQQGYLKKLFSCGAEDLLQDGNEGHKKKKDKKKKKKKKKDKKKKRCAVVYTSVSPCLSDCFKGDTDKCISTSLSSIFQNFSGSKALVFSKLSGTLVDQETGQISKAAEEALTKVNQAIPVFRCTGSDCFKCFTNNSLSDSCQRNNAKEYSNANQVYVY